MTAHVYHLRFWIEEDGRPRMVLFVAAWTLFAVSLALPAISISGDFIHPSTSTVGRRHGLRSSGPSTRSIRWPFGRMALSLWAGTPLLRKTFSADFI